MSLLSAIPFFKIKQPRQVISSSWDERKTILESDVNLFVWNRPIVESTNEYLMELMENDLQPLQFQTGIDEVEEKVRLEKRKWDQKESDQGEAFWDDVVHLILDFLDLSNSQSGTVHMKVVDTNSCAKFHTDGYSLRLFTTYIGQGTEWLPEKATNRRGLGKTNERIVRDPNQVQQMKAFEVGILKGELPGQPNTTKGIVHKSPRIAETGSKRIILRVDI